MEDVIVAIGGAGGEQQHIPDSSDISTVPLGMEADLGVFVEPVNFLVEARFQVPGLGAMAFGNKDAASPHRADLQLCFGEDIPVGAKICLGPAVCQIHPGRIAEIFARVAVRVDHPERLEKFPHHVIDLVAELGADLQVILERGGQIAEHGVILGWQRHEVARVGRHDLFDAPVEIVEGHIHMQGRTDIQTNHDAVQFAHDNVFETAAHQLLAAAEHLGSDKPGDVIDMDPRGSRLAGPCPGGLHILFEHAGKAVFARFVGDHVKTGGVAVGRVGALPGFKIQPVRAGPRGCVAAHFFNGDIEGLVGRDRAREALEP